MPNYCIHPSCSTKKQAWCLAALAEFQRKCISCFGMLLQPTHPVASTEGRWLWAGPGKGSAPGPPVESGMVTPTLRPHKPQGTTGTCGGERCWVRFVCVRSAALSYLTLWQLHGVQPARLLCPWESLGKNTGVGCHFLLQGIFLIQGSNLHLIVSPALAGRFFTGTS